MKILTQPPFWRHVARAMGSRLFHWAENNSNCSINRDGERWLVEALFRRWAGEGRPSVEPRIIFDVGANVGDFSAAVLKAADRWRVPVQVVAFDPGRVCQAALCERLGSDLRFELVPAAVADANTRGAFFSPAPGSGHASLVQRENAGGAETEMVDVVRLDDFLKTRKMPRIDFLKLDIEGSELAALRGLGEWLRPAQAAVIQFEYGGTTLDAGARLRDFFDLLERNGYAVAKLFPRGLEVRRYAPWMDHFTYANFVALDAGWKGATEGS
jgi:FkbM family methyltransferase